MPKILVNTRHGFHWAWNVYANGVPVKGLGRVFYTVNDFGELHLVDLRQVVVSLG